jgi:hypothetical protein
MMVRVHLSYVVAADRFTVLRLTADRRVASRFGAIMGKPTYRPRNKKRIKKGRKRLTVRLPDKYAGA